MNANRRLEEFIFKLNNKQNEACQSDKVNKPKLNSIINYPKMNKVNSDTNNCKNHDSVFIKRL
jgi:hypothetical protein